MNSMTVRQLVEPGANAGLLKKLVLQRVSFCASFVPLEFTVRSSILESQVRPDRADRYSAGGDNHRTWVNKNPKSPDKGDRTLAQCDLSPLSGLA